MAYRSASRRAVGPAQISNSQRPSSSNHSTRHWPGVPRTSKTLAGSLIRLASLVRSFGHPLPRLDTISEPVEAVGQRDQRRATVWKPRLSRERPQHLRVASIFRKSRLVLNALHVTHTPCGQLPDPATLWLTHGSAWRLISLFWRGDSDTPGRPSKILWAVRRIGSG